MKKTILSGLLLASTSLTPIQSNAENKNHTSHTSYIKTNPNTIEIIHGNLTSSFPTRPDFSYNITEARLKITDFRNNGSLFANVAYSQVTEGPGNYLASAGLLYRYNIHGENTTINPYIQMGLGLLINDVYKERYYPGEHRIRGKPDPVKIKHDNLGSMLQADIKLAAGIAFRITDTFNILTEFAYEHISNANYTERNNGFDSFGALIGIRKKF
ncbi:MAG: acyloxyacyl hydrolase [Candidatus Woesearchaeota archaeon]